MPTSTETDAKTCKTVAVSNELDGMRVLRTSHVNDTLMTLASLTHSISRTYARKTAPAAGACVCVSCQKKRLFGVGFQSLSRVFVLFADWARELHAACKTPCKPPPSGPVHEMQAVTRASKHSMHVARCMPSAGGVAAPGAGEDFEDGPLPEYQEWSARLKRLKDNRTVKDVWGLMLCAVPGEPCIHL